MKHRWIIASLAVCLGSVAHAETWHVATTGNDSNPGTEAAPFQTIQRGVTSVGAGDTVLVHAGTYTGFAVTKSGTQGAPITVKADGIVAISGATTTNRDAVLVDGASWVVIEGLTVTGATRAGIAAQNCSNITVRGNHIDQNGRWGVFSSFCDDFVVEDNELSRSGREHGVYASNSADRPIIRRNYIWGNGMCGVHMNGDINFGGDGVISDALVENNVIINNGALGGSAINGDGVASSTIRNNVIDGNHASGISLYRIDGGAGSSNNLIINNTIRMANDARFAINIQDGSTNNTLSNNILLHPNSGRGAVTICTACLSGTKSDHNAVVGRFEIHGAMTDLAGWRTRTGDVASFTATDAQLFAGPTAGDLTLSAASAAIDMGSATNAPATDITGVPRPQGNAIDIGAYEYCSSGSCAGSDGGGSDDGGAGEGSGSGSGSDDGEDFSGPVVDDNAGGCNAAGDVGWLVGPGWLLAQTLMARRRRRPKR